MMRRRTALGLVASALAAPALVTRALGQSPSVLRFCPDSDLTVLDPVWTTATITQTHTNLVFDMLFALDAQFQVQPQMAEGASTSDDGLVWTIRLRDGLLFHDNTPVLARDAVASIRRWGARDPFGQSLMAATAALDAPDDRTIRFRLHHPFPLLTAALGKPIANLCAIMPERLAQTDPAQQVTEMIGSGPYRFLPGERVVGARVAYERFAGYKPRPGAAPGFTAGPKVAHFERIEWTIIPDPATAAAALRNNEIDWLETPDSELLPMLRGRANLKVAITNPSGRIAFLRPNHLLPPFDKQAVRQVLMRAIDQSAFMAAVAGTDPSLSRAGVGFFTPGSPSASTAGLETWASRPPVEQSRAAMRAAGYAGESVTVLAPGDRPSLRAVTDVAVDLMQKLGMTVDYQVVDWGTVVARRAKKDPPSQGGWNMIPGDWIGLDAANPSAYPPLRTNGGRAWFGWPDSPEIERLRTEWLSADAAQQKVLTAAMQRQAFIDVPFIPVGQYFTPTAFNRSIDGIIDGPTMFWNVRRV